MQKERGGGIAQKDALEIGGQSRSWSWSWSWNGRGSDAAHKKEQEHRKGKGGDARLSGSGSRVEDRRPRSLRKILGKIVRA